MSKPMQIFKAGLSGRYYATKTYKDLENGNFMVTGAKHDVTEHVQAHIDQETEALKQQVTELESVIEHMGEISDTCTKNYTGKVCNTCRCKHAKHTTKEGDCV